MEARRSLFEFFRPVRVFAAALALVVAGCATPVGVRSVRPAEAERLLTADILNARQPSPWSAQFLARLGLTERYAKDPAGVLSEIHRGLGGMDESRRLFVLAELAFDHADRSGDHSWFLASAAYAWAYLFPEDPSLAPDRFDPRLRLTMALYNRAVGRGLAAAGHHDLDVGARGIPLPFGKLEVASPGEFRFGQLRVDSVVSVAEMDVRGLRNHYRRSGIGAPVIGNFSAEEDSAPDRWLGDDPRVPLTLLLRFHDLRSTLRDGAIGADLELIDPETREKTSIGGWEVPVEADTTAAIAYGLEGAPVWDFEIAGFRRGDLTLGGNSGPGARLYMMHPWVPGRIPVVFVHGTASSPARWSEMLNELEADPNLRGRYQYWFFMYNTGNPVAASAAGLRENLENVVADLDPHHLDPALSKMVVIGHSQGGLLTKMTVVRSGDLFWKTLSDQPFEAATLRPETREYIRRTSFVEPLPFVNRVVFIATPHGGTVLASNWLGRLARRFIRLPGSLASISLDLLRLQVRGALQTAMQQMPTSIDNMSPSDPFLHTLHSLPVAAPVVAHSIIAVRGAGPPEDGGDGVVAYRSAHLDGVASELVVHSGHSTQGEPATIEEVRRILYDHLAMSLDENPGAGATAPTGSPAPLAAANVASPVSATAPVFTPGTAKR